MIARNAARRARRSAATYMRASAVVDDLIADLMTLSSAVERLGATIGQTAIRMQPDVTPQDLLAATRQCLRTVKIPFWKLSTGDPTEHPRALLATFDETAARVLNKLALAIDVEASAAVEFSADFVAVGEARMTARFEITAAMVRAGIDPMTIGSGGRMLRVCAAWIDDPAAALDAVHGRALVAETMLAKFTNGVEE
ncbi:hypothetical protein [Sphingomonas oligophenolica]|uniref:Uncharacterized protein n=1 Tax=Sphingomonas oligophenolica TaxID=301154 RepID=A0A502CJ08_9SPHN|nr:hypothetical protein [Sphingomonas oligophenolica]TPG13177.1 hypothetical protein EAH84_07190 [Sphingomonas oligophenolica]